MSLQQTERCAGGRSPAGGSASRPVPGALIDRMTRRLFPAHHGHRRPGFPPVGRCRNPGPGSRGSCLTLLLAAPLLLGAASAAAQTVWSTTVTTYDRTAQTDECSAHVTACPWTFADDDFVHDGTTYTVTRFDLVGADWSQLEMVIEPPPPAAFRSKTRLYFRGLRFSLTEGFSSSSDRHYKWYWRVRSPLRWRADEQFPISLRQSAPATPAAPSRLTVTPGDGKLFLSSEAPLGAVTGYEVQYRHSAATGTAVTGNPGTGWVALDRAGPEATVAGLTNGTRYDVRIRAVNVDARSDWTAGSGTPGPRSAQSARPAELESVSLFAAGRQSDGTRQSREAVTTVPTADGFAARVAAWATDVEVIARVRHRNRGSPKDSVSILGESAKEGVSLRWVSLAADAVTTVPIVVRGWYGNTRTYALRIARGAAALGLGSDVQHGEGSPDHAGGSGPDSDVEDRPLTASFGQVPEGHDGGAFAFLVRFSEALGASGSRTLRPDSFEVARGRVKGVKQVDAGLWRVRVAPKSWKRDVAVTLAGGRDCDAEGAVCMPDGRALTNTSSAEVPGPVRIKVAGGKAREGVGASIGFAVTLNRAASGAVTVDYATADGTAVAGEDYTATGGTLTFGAGETEKTVSVALLDDGHDEGKETFSLTLSNATGARILDGKATGTIRNSDPLQRTWLGRFGHAAAADAIAAVAARFETPRDTGSHLTLGGHRLSLGGSAETGGAAGLPAGGPGVAGWPGWSEDAGGSRSMSARELLMGTSFRAVLGQGAGAQWTSWGQGASVSQFSSATPGLSLSGEAATGSLGMDYERGSLLAGFALTHTLGEGAAHGAGRRYAMGSSVTAALPYARFALSPRLSAWGLAGTGSGALTLELDDAAHRHRADLSMTLAAAGVRGELLTPAQGASGFALALKADAFWVRTESDAVSAPGVGNLAAARADATRLRAVLDGSRTFSLTSGATLAPSVELGLRHDGGDASTGTGLELGAGLGYADPLRGLDMALRVHGLAASAEDGYREWGVSGSLEYVPGAAGRGLSMSLTPSYGAEPGGSERLWTLPDASRLAANDDAPLATRLDAELGYGLPVFGGGFTGTPNLGFGLSDTARDWRLGWRLTSALDGDPGFELSLDATRRESADRRRHRPRGDAAQPHPSGSGGRCGTGRARPGRRGEPGGHDVRPRDVHRAHRRGRHGPAGAGGRLRVGRPRRARGPTGAWSRCANPVAAQLLRRRTRPSRSSVPCAGRTGRCAGRPLPTRSELTCASASSHTSRGASVHSAAQSRNEERNPCGTASISSSCSSLAMQGWGCVRPESEGKTVPAERTNGVRAGVCRGDTGRTNNFLVIRRLKDSRSYPASLCNPRFVPRASAYTRVAPARGLSSRWSRSAQCTTVTASSPTTSRFPSFSSIRVSACGCCRSMTSSRTTMP